MAGPRCALDALVAAQIEIKLGRMGDADIDRSPSRDVATFARLFLFIGAKQTRVMALLNHDKCNPGFVVGLQFNTRLTHSRQFMLKHLFFQQKLSIKKFIPDARGDDDRPAPTIGNPIRSFHLHSSCFAKWLRSLVIAGNGRVTTRTKFSNNRRKKKLTWIN